MKRSVFYLSRSVIVILVSGLLLASCVNYQPRVLVPNLTLSPEDLELNTATDNSNPGVDFGLEAVVNESDSLFNVEILPGVRIRSVALGGPADQAGLQVGDVILSVNGTETNEPDTLIALAQQNQNQLDYRFQIRRNTSVLEANLIARAVGSTGVPLRELYRVDPIASRAGYQTQLLTVRGQPDITAAQIVDIQPGSPLITDGFLIDDMIIAINGQSVGSAQGLISRFNTDFELGDTVSLTVYRNNQLQEQSLTLWDPGRRISQISLWPLLQYTSTLSPQSTSLSVLDFWLFSIYRFDRTGGERQHRLFELIRFSSDYGELVEETE